jgi:hypothetical protein
LNASFSFLINQGYKIFKGFFFFFYMENNQTRPKA